MTESSENYLFDSDDYLATRFGDTNRRDRVQFPLEMFHREFSSLPDSNLKILDYGTGPSIMSIISAPVKASELILCEYSPRNRSTLRLWLESKPGAFNWRPCFEHVVCKLEGKSAEEVVAREALVREKVKNVVSGDINTSCIIEKGFEGPYDVVSSSGCLESTCTTREVFSRNVEKLCSLIKPGGHLMFFCSWRKLEPECGVYYVGSEKLHVVSVDTPYVVDLVQRIGFRDVRSSECRLQSQFQHKFQDNNLLGYMFVSGQKI